MLAITSLNRGIPPVEIEQGAGLQRARFRANGLISIKPTSDFTSGGGNS